MKCYEQKNRSAATASSRQNYLQAMSALDECASKADAFSDQVLLFRQKRLSTDFNKQIQKIEEEVRTFLFDYFEMKKRIQLVEFNLSKKVYNKIKERLADAKDFIIKYRPSWEAEVARSARNLFIHRPAEYPYPILYTREGLIYIIQEVVEHFVGVGSTKYVSRTFEMQCGDIRALIRPKKKIS